YLKERELTVFVSDAKSYLDAFPGKIAMPVDLAYEANGERRDISIEELPSNFMYKDIGRKTIAEYQRIISEASTLFVNGPAGVYEEKLFEEGTRAIWKAIAAARGYSFICGGDTVFAAAKFVDLKDINYVCTAGGAMVQYLSGKRLPLIAAMEKAHDRDSR